MHYQPELLAYSKEVVYLFVIFEFLVLLIYKRNVNYIKRKSQIKYTYVAKHERDFSEINLLLSLLLVFLSSETFKKKSKTKEQNSIVLIFK